MKKLSATTLKKACSSNTVNFVLFSAVLFDPLWNMRVLCGTFHCLIPWQTLANTETSYIMLPGLSYRECSSETTHPPRAQRWALSLLLQDHLLCNLKTKLMMFYLLSAYSYRNTREIPLLMVNVAQNVSRIVLSPSYAVEKWDVSP